MINLDSGALTIEYTLPLGGKPATARKLELASGGGFPAADLSAYDYTHRTWLQLAHNAGAAASSSAERTGARPHGRV